MPKRSSQIELVVKTAVDKAIKDLNLTEKEIDDLALAGKKADSHFQGLGRSVKAFISVMAIKEAAQFTFEIGKLAARAETVGQAFRNKFGAEANLVLKELRENTKGAITDLDLMINAIQAEKLGASIDTLRTFSQFARMEAAEQGAETLTIFNNIISGVLRGSTELLDNFGISLTELNKTIEIMAEEKMGKAATKLSAVEKRIISVDAAVKIMNDRLAETDLGAITDAEKIQSAAVAWENVKVELGKIFSGPIAEGLAWFAQQMKEVNNTFDVQRAQEYTKEMTRLIGEISKVDDLLIKYKGKEDTRGYRRLQERLKALQDEQDALNIQYGYLDKIKNKTDDLADSTEKLALTIKTNLGEAIKYFDPIFSRAIDKIDQKMEAIKADEPLLLVDEDTIEKQNQVLEEIGRAIEDKYRSIADNIDDVFVSPMENMVEDILRGTKSAENIWDQFLDNLSNSINEWLASKVVETFISFIADLFTDGLYSSINNGSSSTGTSNNGGWASAGGGQGPASQIDINTASAPSIDIGSLPSTIKEINNNTNTIMGKIIVEAIAPESIRVREYYVDLNRNIIMPDQDYVNATRRTKPGEFD